MIDRLEKILGRVPLLAVLVYLGLVAFFAFAALQNVLQILERNNAVAAAASVLEQFEARGPARPGVEAQTDVSVPAGSPFLEGATVSVAGAALLQRVTAATTRVRGNILSSQVDLQGPQSKGGGITATVSFEIEPASLQPLLYDLEAGMPFLFIDQLAVQAPSAPTQGSKLKVLLAVSGQWQGQGAK